MLINGNVLLPPDPNVLCFPRMMFFLRYIVIGNLLLHLHFHFLLLQSRLQREKVNNKSTWTPLLSYLAFLILRSSFQREMIWILLIQNLIRLLLHQVFHLRNLSLWPPTFLYQLFALDLVAKSDALLDSSKPCCHIIH
jgi:hypothetical protein